MIFTEWNWDDCIAVREKEAEARGERRGEARGFFKTAKSMLAKGMSIDLISEVTGLRKNEIKRIRP